MSMSMSMSMSMLWIKSHFPAGAQGQRVDAPRAAATKEDARNSGASDCYGGAVCVLCSASSREDATEGTPLFLPRASLRSLELREGGPHLARLRVRLRRGQQVLLGAAQLGESEPRLSAPKERLGRAGRDVKRRAARLCCGPVLAQSELASRHVDETREPHLLRRRLALVRRGGRLFVPSARGRLDRLCQIGRLGRARVGRLIPPQRALELSPPEERVALLLLLELRGEALGEAHRPRLLAALEAD
mmetsp:Transcript_5852/g.17041  ORF Transcript_5852/g.17041 Transcript_5852/m.17041 type:complete len:246 (+) Transcript_5852:3-740(+)